jgi:hypothetical protein
MVTKVFQQKNQFKITIFLVLMLVMMTSSHKFFTLGKSIDVNSKDKNLTPSQVVKIFWQLSEKGDIEKAAKYMTNEAPISPGVKVGSNRALDTQPKLIYELKEKLLKIISERVDGDKAEVVAEVLRPNKKVWKFNHTLYKDKGEWKIFGIS